MAIDYFIKLMEPKPLAKITEARVNDFIWKFSIYHFGLLRILIMDNDYQFSGAKLARFCKDLGIFHYFTLVGHLQAMGRLKLQIELFYKE